MNEYWVLQVEGLDGQRRATIGEQPNLSELSGGGLLNWTAGIKFNETIPEPLTFKLNMNSGNYITDFFPPAIPLMSVGFLSALQKSGVDNIDAYDAILLGKDGQPLNEEFKAVNIIGRIACADLDKSICDVDDQDDPVGVDFESLVIDVNRAQGAKFFRLHEAVNAIIVHVTVKESVEKLNFRGINFIAPEDWIG